MRKTNRSDSLAVLVLEHLFGMVGQASLMSFFCNVIWNDGYAWDPRSQPSGRLEIKSSPTRPDLGREYMLCFLPEKWSLRNLVDSLVGMGLHGMGENFQGVLGEESEAPVGQGGGVHGTWGHPVGTGVLGFSGKLLVLLKHRQVQGFKC